jgi:undecaprenyl-diphosphatase
MNLYDKLTPDERLLYWAVIIFAVTLLALLTLLMRQGIINRWDEWLLAWLHSHQNPIMNFFFPIVTWLGSLKVLLPVSIGLSIWLLARGHQREAYLFNLGFLGATSTTYLLKFLLARKRPAAVLGPDSLPPDPSFPSAHTTQAFAFALMLWLVVAGVSGQWRFGTGVMFLLAAATVALSRMYLQVHFPSDVLAGMLVAVSWASLIVIVAKSGILT